MLQIWNFYTKKSRFLKNYDYSIKHIHYRNLAKGLHMGHWRRRINGAETSRHSGLHPGHDE